MDDRIAEIRARWAAATPGPWVHETGHSDIEAAAGGSVAVVCEHSSLHTMSTRGEEYSHADAEAIPAAPDDVAWLLAEIERLRAEVETYDAALADTHADLRASHAEIKRLRDAVDAPTIAHRCADGWRLYPGAACSTCGDGARELEGGEIAVELTRQDAEIGRLSAS